MAQFIRFIAVGATNTLVSFIVFNFAYLLLGGSRLGNALSFYSGHMAGMIWAYAMHRHFTFRSTGNPFLQGASFLLVQVVLAVASQQVLDIGHAITEIDPRVLWIPVVAVNPLINYLALKMLVFKNSAGAKVYDMNSICDSNATVLSIRKDELQSVQGKGNILP